MRDKGYSVFISNFRFEGIKVKVACKSIEILFTWDF